MKQVAVIYNSDTLDVISVQTDVEINVTGPPILDAGQDCVVTSMEFYDRFASEEEFLAALSVDS